MEAMDVAHFGVNRGTQTVRLLAVYMGAEDAEDVDPGEIAGPENSLRRRYQCGCRYGHIAARPLPSCNPERFAIK